MALASVSGGGGDGTPNVWQQPLSEVSTALKETLGVVRREGNKWYKYVQFVAGTAAVNASAGDVLNYVSYDGATVNGDKTDMEASLCAGVTQVALTGGTGATGNVNSYVWLQIKGIAAIETDTTAGSAGNALTGVGAGDLTLDVSAAVTDPIVGVLIDATNGAEIIYCDFPW